MTVAELIEVLKTMPQDAVVLVLDVDGERATLKSSEIKYCETEIDYWQRNGNYYEDGPAVRLQD